MRHEYAHANDKCQRLRGYWLGPNGIPCGIPCRAGYHAARDTMPCGIPCCAGTMPCAVPARPELSGFLDCGAPKTMPQLARRPRCTSEPSLTLRSRKTASCRSVQCDKNAEWVGMLYTTQPARRLFVALSSQAQCESVGHCGTQCATGLRKMGRLYDEQRRPQGWTSPRMR